MGSSLVHSLSDLLFLNNSLQDFHSQRGCGKGSRAIKSLAQAASQKHHDKQGLENGLKCCLHFIFCVATNPPKLDFNTSKYHIWFFFPSSLAWTPLWCLLYPWCNCFCLLSPVATMSHFPSMSSPKGKRPHGNRTKKTEQKKIRDFSKGPFDVQV